MKDNKITNSLDIPSKYISSKECEKPQLKQGNSLCQAFPGMRKLHARSDSRESEESVKIQRGKIENSLASLKPRLS